MLKRKSIFWASIVLSALILTDCQCTERQIIIKSVLLQIPPNVSGFSKSVDREKISQLIKSTIDKNPHFHFDEKRDDGRVLKLTLSASNGGKNPSLLLAAALGDGKSESLEEKRAFVDVVLANGAATGQDIGRSVSKLLQNLYQLESGQGADNSSYLERVNASLRGEAISSADLVTAVSVLGHAREKKAAPSLIELLSTTDDLAVGNACLMALGEMQSEQAMPAIIDFVERKPPILRRQAIIAARRIGSKLAAEWLLVMAYGHEDPIVHKEALAALQEVEEKLNLPKE